MVTSHGVWRAETVVMAAGLTRGRCRRRPRRCPRSSCSLHAIDYRNPNQLPEGGVLVVGPSSSGVQIAEEVHLSGRPVTLATGEHVRLPRRYRDRDILWWMDAVGILDERWDEVDDVLRARSLPSMQLVGGTRSLDLNVLQSLGIRLTGRLAGIRDGQCAVLGLAPQRVHARRPEAGAAPEDDRRVRRGHRRAIRADPVPQAPLDLDLTLG